MGIPSATATTITAPNTQGTERSANMYTNEHNDQYESQGIAGRSNGSTYTPASHHRQQQQQQKHQKQEGGSRDEYPSRPAG